jgi:hypothetical protein
MLAIVTKVSLLMNAACDANLSLIQCPLLPQTARAPLSADRHHAWGVHQDWARAHQPVAGTDMAFETGRLH